MENDPPVGDLRGLGLNCSDAELVTPDTKELSGMENDPPVGDRRGFGLNGSDGKLI